ncbi:hypothetical protein ACFQV8_13180 [Pseudonocardia benzenivorans]
MTIASAVVAAFLLVVYYRAPWTASSTARSSSGWPSASWAWGWPWPGRCARS